MQASTGGFKDFDRSIVVGQVIPQPVSFEANRSRTSCRWHPARARRCGIQLEDPLAHLEPSAGEECGLEPKEAWLLKGLRLLHGAGATDRHHVPAPIAVLIEPVGLEAHYCPMRSRSFLCSSHVQDDAVILEAISDRHNQRKGSDVDADAAEIGTSQQGQANVSIERLNLVPKEAHELLSRPLTCVRKGRKAL
jgi:hypothetical protein